MSDVAEHNCPTYLGVCKSNLITRNESILDQFGIDKRVEQEIISRKEKMFRFRNGKCRRKDKIL